MKGLSLLENWEADPLRADSSMGWPLVCRFGDLLRGCVALAPLPPEDVAALEQRAIGEGEGHGEVKGLGF